MVGRREQVAARKQAIGPNLPLFLEGLFDYGLALAGAEIRWVETFLQQLEKEAKSALRP